MILTIFSNGDILYKGGYMKRLLGLGLMLVVGGVTFALLYRKPLTVERALRDRNWEV